MDQARFTHIDSFPFCAKRNRILITYAVWSTKITIAAVGSRYVLLYADKKRLGRYALPHRVTCATVITTPPKSEDAKGDGKVLICGSASGVVFAIELPNNKEAVSTMKNRASNGGPGDGVDYLLIYKYTNLDILSLSCFDGHLLIVGKVESGETRMFMFHPTVLATALSYNQNIVTPSPPYQFMQVEKPSIGNSKSDGGIKLVIFQPEPKKTGPYYNSLSSVCCIDRVLFSSLFGSEFRDAMVPVVCFFFTGGEVWFFALKDVGLPRKSLEHLFSLEEDCSAVVTALLGSSFMGIPRDDPGIDGPLGLRPALLLLGVEHNVHFLTARAGVKNDGSGFNHSFVPYAMEVRAQASDWNNLISLPDEFLRTCEAEKGINVTSVQMNFKGEQRLGFKVNGQSWTFHEYEDHVALVSINALYLDPNQKAYGGSSTSRVHELLKLMEKLNQEYLALKGNSLKLTNALKAVQSLATYIMESQTLGQISLMKNSIMNFDISHMVVQCADGKYVNVNVKISRSDMSFILSDFAFDIQAIIRCVGSPYSQTDCFSMDDFENCTRNLCIMVKYDDLCRHSHNKLEITFMVNIFRFKLSDYVPAGSKLLHSSFPLFFPVFYWNVAISE